MPAAACAQLPFRAAILLIGSKIDPQNIWGINLKLITQISSTPLHNFGLRLPQRGSPPLPSPSFPCDIALKCLAESSYVFIHVFFVNSCFFEAITSLKGRQKSIAGKALAKGPKTLKKLKACVRSRNFNSDGIEDVCLKADYTMKDGNFS